jgi:hypothetical protein
MPLGSSSALGAQANPAPDRDPGPDEESFGEVLSGFHVPNHIVSCVLLSYARSSAKCFPQKAPDPSQNSLVA